MSVDRCARCGDLVDTDEEPEAYVEVGPGTLCLCREHREQLEEDREYGSQRVENRQFIQAQQAVIDAAEKEESSDE